MKKLYKAPSCDLALFACDMVMDMPSNENETAIDNLMNIFGNQNQN